MARAPIRLQIAKFILGSKAKDFIPSLAMLDNLSNGGSSRLKTYTDKESQLSANLNWSYAANKAIVDVCASVPLKIYRKKADGDLEEATDSKALSVLNLLANPNNAHTGEQMAQLHYTYMNFAGEAYTMMFRAGQPWTPVAGQLPDALQEIPAHLCQFKLSKQGYSQSTVRYNNQEYPLSVFVRDLNPDPANPYNGQSIIAAAASIINLDAQMRDWNNRLMANGARPSLIFTANEAMDQEVYNRWEAQFSDKHSGPENAGRPLLIEGGDAKPYMLSPQDLDFLESRKFGRDEILAMWGVNPYIIGSVEDVNLATARAARTQHAEKNVEPRVRQWVRQMNATFIQVFDPALELGYENPVPEDVDAKLAYVQAAVNKFITIDEARDQYGEEALPGGLGEQLYLINNNAPLSAIADGSAKPQPIMNPNAPAADNPDDGTDDPNKDGKKSLGGVKKRPDARAAPDHR